MSHNRLTRLTTADIPTMTSLAAFYRERGTTGGFMRHAVCNAVASALDSLITAITKHGWVDSATPQKVFREARKGRVER